MLAPPFDCSISAGTPISNATRQGVQGSMNACWAQLTGGRVQRIYVLAVDQSRAVLPAVNREFTLKTGQTFSVTYLPEEELLTEAKVN